MKPIENRIGAWLQDDWAATRKLTLNLGVRYDMSTGMFAEDVEVQPFLNGHRHADKNNIAPRLGFTYAVDPRTVVRGGFGQYFGDNGFSQAHWTNLWAGQVHPVLLNDGRPDFATNPFNGPIPTYAQAKALQNQAKLLQLDHDQLCVARVADAAQLPVVDRHAAAAWRRDGVRRRTTSSPPRGTRPSSRTSTWRTTRRPGSITRSRIARESRMRSFGWDQVSMSLTEGKDNYQTVQMSFTKRMANRWQASATYSLSADRLYQRAPIAPGCSQLFTINASASSCATSRSRCTRRWRRNGTTRACNGIASRSTASGSCRTRCSSVGCYIFGDNGWATPATGQDAFATGATTGPTSRVRPATSPFFSKGALIPWSSFDLSSLSRVDMRLQRKFTLSRRVAFDGILEVFNVFNRANYGSWVTNEGNARYGLPTDNNNIAFMPRLMQLGFRRRSDA